MLYDNRKWQVINKALQLKPVKQLNEIRKFMESVTSDVNELITSSLRNRTEDCHVCAIMSIMENNILFVHQKSLYIKNNETSNNNTQIRWEKCQLVKTTLLKHN